MMRNPTYHVGREVLEISGRFRTNGAVAIDNSLNVGIGFVVTRTNVGVATIKLLEQARALLHFEPQLWKVAPTGAGQQMRLVVSDFAQGADGLWTVTIAQTDLNNAGPAAIEFSASDAKNWISFTAKLQKVAP
jgi:hypothetical protein